MSKRKHNSNYFADDKDIFDAIHASKNTVFKPRRLVDLAGARGIFLSEETPVDDIIEYISSLSYGWNDLQDLMKGTDPKSHKKKRSSEKIQTKLSKAKINDAIADVAKGLQATGHRVETLPIKSQKSTKMTVRYDVVTEGKTRLLQREERSLEIRVEMDGQGEFRIRYDDQDKAKEVVDKIVKSAEAKDKKIQRRTIQISNISDCQKRTQFFINLINEMPGFKLEEVLDLKVAHEKSLDQEDPEVDIEKVASEVRNAALSGRRITNTKLFLNLKSSGYFIYWIHWSSVRKAIASSPSIKIEFDAGFKAANRMATFSYKPRHYLKEREGGGWIQTKHSFAGLERRDLERLLEDAAFEALAKVKKIGVS